MSTTPYERNYLVWYLGKDAEMNAYADLADAAYQAAFNTTDVFCHRDMRDRFGRLVTAYFGPTGLGTEENPGPPEPADCFAARGSHAVLTNVIEHIPDDI